MIYRLFMSSIWISSVTYITASSTTWLKLSRQILFHEEDKAVPFIGSWIVLNSWTETDTHSLSIKNENKNLVSDLGKKRIFKLLQCRSPRESKTWNDEIGVITIPFFSKIVSEESRWFVVCIVPYSATQDGKLAEIDSKNWLYSGI